MVEGRGECSGPLFSAQCTEGGKLVGWDLMPLAKIPYWRCLKTETQPVVVLQIKYLYEVVKS